MKYNQVRKGRTGNVMVYKRIVSVEENSTHGQTKVILDCGHHEYFTNCGRDRIKLAMFKMDPENALLGCKQCGKDSQFLNNTTEDKNGR